jgi:hypothetical protein
MHLLGRKSLDEGPHTDPFRLRLQRLVLDDHAQERIGLFVEEVIDPRGKGLHVQLRLDLKSRGRGPEEPA